MTAPSLSSPMADSDAVIITFTHEGRSYNVWTWVHPGNPDGMPSCAVNYRAKDAWVPIGLDGGHIAPIEVQGSLGL